MCVNILEGGGKRTRCQYFLKVILHTNRRHFLRCHIFAISNVLNVETFCFNGCLLLKNVLVGNLSEGNSYFFLVILWLQELAQ